MLFPKLAELRKSIENAKGRLDEAYRVVKKEDDAADALNLRMTVGLCAARDARDSVRTEKESAELALEKERMASLDALRTMEGEDSLTRVALELDLLDSVERALVQSPRYSGVDHDGDLYTAAIEAAALEAVAIQAAERREELELRLSAVRDRVYRANLRRTPELLAAVEAATAAAEHARLTGEASWTATVAVAKKAIVSHRKNATKLPIRAIWAALSLLDGGHL